MAKNILIIDDDGLVTKSLCDLLTRSEYSAEALNNGFDAIEKIKDTHVDLIIVDIRMPGINGVETVKKIKDVLKSKHKRDIPVVFITGYTESKETAEAKQLGDIIYKPFDNKEFLDFINNYR